MSEAVNPAERKREARYHHGDLRAALLDAGEAELAEKGYAGFTLRGTAKRAGVSHAAPAHHFRDANALLTALAARGFARLSAAMQTAQAVVAPDPEAQLVASGIGYFQFGLENPALLQLMFGPARPERKDPALRRSGEACFGESSSPTFRRAATFPHSNILTDALWSPPLGPLCMDSRCLLWQGSSNSSATATAARWRETSPPCLPARSARWPARRRSQSTPDEITQP